MTDAAAMAAPLLANAAEALPEGALAEQLVPGQPLRVKFGIDPTAPDIHLGHAVVLFKLRQFQDAGHLVVLIVGDYTARVGDPSGLSIERPVLSAAQIDANAETFQQQAFSILDRERTEVRFNSEWLDMRTDELFGLVGKATVARLLERDDFSKRMKEGKPISALELLYPVFQGYDSVAIKADVELGGTDQKFNLLFARDIQQAYGLSPQSVLTMPILPGTDGVQRMSKSLGNYVGVTDPPAEMFGKLMSIPDSAMEEYYRLLLSEDTPAGHPGEAKRALGRRLVERFHGAGAARDAEAAFDRIHVEGALPDEIPEVSVGRSAPVHLPALLSKHLGLSRSEARRLIGQGGVKLNGRVLADEELDLEPAALEGAVIQVGKRRHLRVRLS